MKSTLSAFMLLLFSSSILCQPLSDRAPDGGGAASVQAEKTPCLMPDERARIEAALAASSEQLRREGRTKCN